MFEKQVKTLMDELFKTATSQLIEQGSVQPTVFLCKNGVGVGIELDLETEENRKLSYVMLQKMMRKKKPDFAIMMSTAQMVDYENNPELRDEILDLMKNRKDDGDSDQRYERVKTLLDAHDPCMVLFFYAEWDYQAVVDVKKVIMQNGEIHFEPYEVATQASNLGFLLFDGIFEKPISGVDPGIWTSGTIGNA